MKQYHKEAMEISELDLSLSNIAVDDNREISSYSLEEIVKEAEWVRECVAHYGSGNKDEHDKLTAFINKWKGETQ